MSWMQITGIALAILGIISLVSGLVAMRFAAAMQRGQPDVWLSDYRGKRGTFSADRVRRINDIRVDETGEL
jgi:hypothetical protein